MASSTNNSFELQAKADEWMDVTPTEELLRSELARLQTAFEKCTTQLDSSRLENDLLKDQGAILEHEAKDLRTLLDRAHVDLDTTQKESAQTKSTLQGDIQFLENNLRDTIEKKTSYEKEASFLREQLANANQQKASEASLHKAVVQKLERDLKTSKAETKTHREAAVGFAEDLRKVRQEHSEIKRLLQKTKQKLASELDLHAETKSTLGKIATLSENIKGEKHGLERALAREQKSTADALSKTATVSKQFTNTKAVYIRKVATLESELKQRMEDLVASNRSLELLQVEVKDTELILKESTTEKSSIKNHLSTMEQGRHELLEHQSELQESLEEALEQNNNIQNELDTIRNLLNETCQKNEVLKHQQLNQMSKREVELEEKLAEQKKVFEKRLKTIHSILGLTFTTAVHSEVKTIHKILSFDEKMPKSFKIPLIQSEQRFRHHPEKQRLQHIKSL